MKEGRYYISDEKDNKGEAFVIYYCQYVSLNGVPCGWRYSYERHPAKGYYAWVTFKEPHFGYEGDRVDEKKLRLIRKRDEGAITCFDDAMPPSYIWLQSFATKIYKKRKINHLNT